MNITAPRFTDETAAREHLEGLRWPEGPYCPHCGSFNAKRLPAVRAVVAYKSKDEREANSKRCAEGDEIPERGKSNEEDQRTANGE